MKMKSNMKKFLALFLSLSLVLAMFGDFAQVKAADSYIDVTLTGLHGNTKFNDSANQVELWFTIEGGFWTDPDDWSHQWEHFKYEVNGVEKRVGIVQSAGPDLLYVTIPYSDVSPTVGNKITIKNGEYAATTIETDPAIHLQNDFEIVFTCDRPVVDTGYKIFDVGSVEIAHQAADTIIFDLKNKEGNTITFGKYPTEGNFPCTLVPANPSGSRMNSASEWELSKNGVFQGESHINYWPAGNFNFLEIDTGRFKIGGLNATEGTVVTVKGAFAAMDGDTWVNFDKCIFKEFNFTYTNGAWVFSKPYQDATITSLFYAQDENGDDIRTRITSTEVQLWLNIDSGAWSTSDWTDWTSQWYKFVYEINGVKKNVAIVQAAGTNLLYVTIPLSDITTEAGTKITIKAGEYPAYQNTNKGINLPNDFEILLTCDEPVVAADYKVFELGSATVVPGTETGTAGFQFTLTDKNGNAFTSGNFTNATEDSWNQWVLCPANEYGNREESANWPTTKNGVFQDGNHINYFPTAAFNFQEINEGKFYIGGLSATNGTTVTIKGAFALTNNANWNDVTQWIFEEFSFTYTNGAWVSSTEPEQTYTEYTGTPELQEWNSNKGLYFLGNETFETTEFPYDTGWNIWVYAIDEEESGVFLNGDKTTAYLKKVDSGRWYIDLEAANVVPEDGDEITIIGTFVYETHRITFDEVTFTYETPEAPVTYQGTPVLAPVDNYGNANGFYVYCDDGAPKTDWGTYYYAQDGDNAGVSVQTSSGTTTYKGITLQKNEANMWYIWLAQESNLSLTYGDVVSIEGSFASEAGTVVTFNKASFQYDGKHFSQGTFTATNTEVVDVYYYETTFANNYWNIYFTSSAELPGDANTTYYPHMTCTIKDANNETEYVSNWFKTGCTNTIDGVTYTTFLIQIPSEKLPQNLEDEYVITLKAGAAQGRTANSGTENAYGLDTAHTTGIRLAEDFSFVVGDCHEATAPAIDYANTSQTGGGNNNLWVTTKDDFPVTSWTYSLKKADENSGIFLYDSGAKKYTPTDGTMKRHMDGGYYIENFGTVESGDIILLKGTFSMSNLSFITFGTAKYEWNGSKWIVCSDIDELESTGVNGDARGDSNLNSADLVRMIKFFGDNKAHTISLLDADLNATGDIDEYDIQIERKLLLGLTLYKGVPTYNDNAEMRLAAFVAPKISEGLQKYADAGFTTIIGEQRAVTEATGDDTDATDADNFDAYMKAVESAGLDVLVQSGAITNMITNGATYSGELIRSEFEKASAYKSFRGFFLADEPNYTQLDIINTISTELKNVAEEKDKKMELFMAGHPTYTEVEIWQDSTLSDNAQYYNYADKLGKSLGEYTYDFYPFRNKQKYILGFIPNGRENYMEDGWLLNLKLAARASKNSQGAFDTGFVVQSYSEPEDDNYIRYIGEEEISFQVYSALAYGMKSLNYFTYGKHWDTEKAPTEKCMTLDNDIYNAVKNVNTEIKEFDHVLLNYNWIGTMGVTGLNSDKIMSQMDADGSETYTSNRISEWSSKNASDATENADAIIGCLKDLNGYDGFMLVNVTDPSDDISENISVTFKETLADGSVLVSTHATVYENGVMKTVPLNDGTFTATLTPGQGIFVIPYIQ